METKTLCIYSVVEKAGKNDSYLKYMLSGLKEICSEIVTAVYDDASEKELSFFKEQSSECIVVKKDMSLSSMYYEALKKINVDKYDQIIFCSSKIFGPIYPLDNLKMIINGKGDFYGISDKVLASKIGNARYDDKEILNLNFFVLKKYVISKLFENKKFEQWKELEDIEYAHEMSEYLVREGYNYYPIFESGFDNFDSMGKIKNGCPFIENDKLFESYIDVLAKSRGEETRRLLKYVSVNTGYNTDMIIEHVLKIYNIADIYNSLHLNYMLSSKDSKSISEVLGAEKAVIVVHIFYMDLIEYFYDYILDIPKEIDVIITTTDTKKGKILEDVFKPVLKDRVRIIVSEGNGRELAALLVEARKYLEEYDYICFTHDKKSLHTGSVSVSRGFQQLIVENVFNSKFYITNILETFKSDRRLGLLVPPPPMHGIYFASLGRRWTLCYEPVIELLSELGVNVDVDNEKNPLATGSAFWCKREAILPILEKEWKHEDFPEEPMANDGTISHAIERSFPFIAQSQGYYTGMVMTLENASLEFTNREYVLEKMHISMHNIIPTFGQNIKSYADKISNLEDVIGIRDIGVKDALKNYVGKIKNKVGSKLNISITGDKKKVRVIENSKLFDAQWYLDNYEDVREQNVNPAWHYVSIGWSEGRNPSEEFSNNEYFKANPDVRSARICPLYHYETAGKFEGRQYKVDKKDEKIVIEPTEKEVEMYNKHIQDVINKQRAMAYKYPVQNNKIVFKTFQSDYTCNPKYICEEILRRKLPYDLVWISKNTKEAIGNYPNEVRVVGDGTLQAKEEIYSAKVLVDNGVHLFNFKEVKKKEQKYICTWHGSLGFKKLSGNKMASKRDANSAKLYDDTNDYVISNSTFEDEVFRESYWPTTEFIKCGHPRNDRLINNNCEYNRQIKEKVYNKLGIPADMKVLLYAPTFREKIVDSDNNVVNEIEELDYNNLIVALEERFGGKWGVIIRAHFVDSKNGSSVVELPENCFAGTKYPDIQELMVAADGALTDYSSWILDYMFTRKPAFLYTPDYEDYDLQRGFCYPLCEAPFSISKNNVELKQSIKTFDEDIYREKIDEFLISKGSREDGNGSKAVVDLIERIINEAD